MSDIPSYSLLHLLRCVPWSPYAGEFQDMTQALLESQGWAVKREIDTAINLDRDGRVDLVALRGVAVVGIELDDGVARAKSLAKLRGMPGLTGRLVVLRSVATPPRREGNVWITGIYSCPSSQKAQAGQRMARARQKIALVSLAKRDAS